MLIFTSFFFLRDKLPINMKILVFSWQNVFGPPQKPWLWTEKNQKALALLCLASKPLRNAANSSGVPTEFATEPTRQI